MLLYFARGSLPWQGLKPATDKDKGELIKERKQELPLESLCEGLPNEFATYLGYTRSLDFHDKPDYAYLRRLFRQAFFARGLQYDNIFDWTARRFYEIRNGVEMNT